MTIFAAILLALTAGITEIFPVSGSGHLYIFAKLLGISASSSEFQSFRGMLCLGAAFSGILFYHTQLFDMLRENLVLFGLMRPVNRRRGEPFGKRLGMLLAIAFLPMLFSLLLNPIRVEMEQGSHLLAIVSGLLCLSGAVQFFTVRGARGKRTIHQMTLPDAVWTGLIQTITLFPGLSRTGFTVSVLMGRGLDGAAAAECSGLMGIPVFLAAGLIQLITVGKGGGAFADAPFLILGFSLSALSGFFALRFFTDLMTHRRPTVFAYWSWGAAIFALILFLISA